MTRGQSQRRGLTAPFTYFGGKRLIATEIWRRLGTPSRYIEPFFGSGAVLLARPDPCRSEIVNDSDCLLANFWRAVQADPDGVARHASHPISEDDMHGRHRWLIAHKPALAALIETHPDAYDARAAGWWVWGISIYLGAWGSRANRSKPRVAGANGVHALSRRDRIPEVMREISDRVRRVRVMCGDWSRAVTSSVLHTNAGGVTAVLLDPPYAHPGRHKRVYADDDASVSALARAWAIERGDDPRLRIALCGYEGEHDMPAGWSVHAWSAQGGMGGAGNRNRHRERVWFSPHCIDGGRS